MIGVVTGLVYAILAISGADGVAWVVPAVVAGAAYSLIALLFRPEPGTRDRRRNRR